MAENDKYMWHKEREYTEKIRQLRGLKDARTESIPVRSTDGAMRSVVQEYDREFIDSPEGFGRAVIDHENGNMQKWFVHAYMREMAYHMLRHSRLPLTEQNADHAWNHPQDFYNRLNPINPMELKTSWPNTDLFLDRPFPDILQDLLKGDSEHRRKAFRYFMTVKRQEEIERAQHQN